MELCSLKAWDINTHFHTRSLVFGGSSMFIRSCWWNWVGVPALFSEVKKCSVFFQHPMQVLREFLQILATLSHNCTRGECNVPAGVVTAMTARAETTISCRNAGMNRKSTQQPVHRLPQIPQRGKRSFKTLCLAGMLSLSFYLLENRLSPDTSLIF